MTVSESESRLDSESTALVESESESKAEFESASVPESELESSLLLAELESVHPMQDASRMVNSIFVMSKLYLPYRV